MTEAGAATRGEDYAQRLVRLQMAPWKRWLNVQAPFRWNLTRLRPGFTLVVGIVGLISPDYGTTVRRAYFAAPLTLYTAAAIRMVMGLVVILAARGSRAPLAMRALGALMSLQGLTATALGPEHARAVLEFETKQGHAILRLGAAVALAAGVFMAYALTGHRSTNAHA